LHLIFWAKSRYLHLPPKPPFQSFIWRIVFNYNINYILRCCATCIPHGDWRHADTPHAAALAWRRGAAGPVRVYAYIMVPPNIYTYIYIHTYYTYPYTPPFFILYPFTFIAIYYYVVCSGRRCTHVMSCEHTRTHA